MKGMVRFWFAPVVLLVGGAFLAAVVDSDDAVDVPTQFYNYGNGFGAGGYDVVAFFEEAAAVPGERGIEAHFGGEVWLFANAEYRDKFLATPRKYIPQYGGHCAYAVANNYTAKGDPKAWTVHDGKLYLNFNKSVRRSWLANRDNFIISSEANWPEVNKGVFEKRQKQKTDN